MKDRVGIGRGAYSAAIASGLLLCLSALRADERDRPEVANPAVADAFEEADLAFRDLYSRGRAATLARLGPVIVVEGDNLVLLRDGRRTEVGAIPPLYHRLKSVSHIPLALYVALAPFGDAPLDGEQLARLRSFRARVQGVAVSLDRSGFSPEQVTRSRTLLDRCTAFIDRVLADGGYKAADLR